MLIVPQKLGTLGLLMHQKLIWLVASALLTPVTPFWNLRYIYLIWVPNYFFFSFNDKSLLLPSTWRGGTQCKFKIPICFAEKTTKMFVITLFYRIYKCCLMSIIFKPVFTYYVLTLFKCLSPFFCPFLSPPPAPFVPENSHGFLTSLLFNDPSSMARIA